MLSQLTDNFKVEEPEPFIAVWTALKRNYLVFGGKNCEFEKSLWNKSSSIKVSSTKVTFYISLIAYKLIKNFWIKENVPLKNSHLKTSV